MNYKDKKSLLDTHFNKGFPNASETDELDDIIAKIAELDSYYAGLAMAAIGGSKVKAESLNDLHRLKGEIKNIDKSKEDIENISSCDKYIDSLIKIVKIIINNQKD